MPALSSGDKFVIYGLLAFIAYELWNQTEMLGNPQARCDFAYSTTTPNWVQQLADARQRQQQGETV